MKVAIALLVLCSLQGSLVMAKTVDEVIEDFLPVLGVLHDDLAGKGYNMFMGGMNKIKEFVSGARWYENYINEEWNVVLISVHTQLESIVTETGMTDRPDEIAHCYDDTNTEFSKLQDLERAGLQIAMATIDNATQTLRQAVRDVRDKQNPVHNDIDAGITRCKDDSGTSVEMQLCLVNHYIQSKTAVQNALKTMNTGMEKIKDASAAQHSISVIAFRVILERVRGVEAPLLDVFRQCCIVASLSRQ